MYDYREELKKDIKAYIEDNRDEIIDGLADNGIALDDKFEVAGYLRDILFACDEVTGNEYKYTKYVNLDTTKKWVLENIDLAVEAITGFDYDYEHLGRKIGAGDYEYLDVTIRCYLLGEILEQVLDEGGI